MMTRKQCISDTGRKKTGLMSLFHRLNKRNGISLIEMVAAMMVVTLVMMTMAALTAAALRSYSRGSNVTYSYMDANRALEWIAKDIRKSYLATIDATATRLTLMMPAINPSTGWAIQPLQSDGHPVIYYLGNSDGTVNPNGTYLWRETTGTGRRSIIAAVAGANFTRTANPFGTNMNLIQVTLTAQRGAGMGTESRNLVTRASVRN